MKRSGQNHLRVLWWLWIAAAAPVLGSPEADFARAAELMGRPLQSDRHLRTARDLFRQVAATADANPERQEAARYFALRLEERVAPVASSVDFAAAYRDLAFHRPGSVFSDLAAIQWVRHDGEVPGSAIEARAGQAEPLAARELYVLAAHRYLEAPTPEIGAARRAVARALVVGYERPRDQGDLILFAAQLAREEGDPSAEQAGYEAFLALLPRDSRAGTLRRRLESLTSHSGSNAPGGQVGKETGVDKRPERGSTPDYP